jgi:hypothetical protein
VLLVATLLAVGAWPAAAQAGTAVSTRLSAAEVRQTQKFWTAARMERAVPLFQPGRSRPPQLTSASRHPAGRVRPHRYPPRAPAAGIATSSAAFETVPDPTLPGIAQNGAIFVVLGPGQLGRCSGMSVSAPSMSVVFTAGHCVHLGDTWFGREWVFVPGYHHGVRPFGTFVAKWLGSPRQWVSSGNENFDVGAAVVSRNERGERLAAAVGGYGIAWNLSPNQVFDVYGYPVGDPFDGSTLQLCAQTPFEGHDLLSFLTPGPLDLAVQCNVTGGASGGGWVIAGGLLNGVTTNGYPEDPTTGYGPYFGNAVGELFHRAARVR